MAWVYLIAAGVFEIGWPLGFKLAQTGGTASNTTGWIIFSVISMTFSGLLLYIAQKSIPIGVAYAAWTGIGAIGTFLIGYLMFNDSVTILSWLGIILIVSGISLLKISVLAR